MVLTIHQFLINGHEERWTDKRMEKLLRDTLLSDKVTFSQYCLIVDALRETYQAGAIDAFKMLKSGT